MNFNDIFKSSFLENITSISFLDMLLALALAFGIGTFIFFVYKKTYTGVLVAAHSGGVGGVDTQDALNLGINRGNGRDAAILLGCFNGSIALCPKGEIGGGGSSAHLGGAGCCGHYRNGNVGVGGAHKRSATAAEHACGNGKGCCNDYFFHGCYLKC